MSRVPRINIENALYYITSRGDNDQDIFRQESDYRAYIDLLKRAKDQYKFMLFAFCLMPNHAHLLIELKGDSITSQIMHVLNSNYIKYFNSKYDRAGHLFQERYKMMLVEKKPNLLDMTAYIHLNPLALGLTKNLAEYAYSSYPAYAGKEKGLIDLKNEINEVLGSLKEKDYAEFVGDFYQDKSKAVSEEINRKSILGSDEFIERVKAEVENTKLQDKKTHGANSAHNKRLALIGIIAIIALGLISSSLFINMLRVKKNLNRQLVNKGKELEVKVEQERERLIKSLEEKNSADRISYRVMQKRLEIEKSKAVVLEKKLNGGKNENKLK